MTDSILARKTNKNCGYNIDIYDGELNYISVNEDLCVDHAQSGLSIKFSFKNKCDIVNNEHSSFFNTDNTKFDIKIDEEESDEDMYDENGEYDFERIDNSLQIRFSCEDYVISTPLRMLINTVGFEIKPGEDIDRISQCDKYEIYTREQRIKSVIDDQDFISESVKFIKHIIKSLRQYVMTFEEAVFFVIKSIASINSHSIKIKFYPTDLQVFKKFVFTYGNDGTNDVLYDKIDSVFNMSVVPRFSNDKLLEAYMAGTKLDWMNKQVLEETINMMTIKSVLKS